MGFDVVVSFEYRLLNLKPLQRQGLWPGARVRVLQEREGTLEVLPEEDLIDHAEIVKRPRPEVPLSKPWRPARNHPWCRGR